MIVEAVKRIDDKVQLIDQTRLPGEVRYNLYDDYKEIIKAIQRLEVRGAPAIGITAAYALAVGVKQLNSVEISEIENVAQDIKNARPTAINLSWAVNRLMDTLKESKAESKEDVLKVLWGEAEAIHEEDRRMCRKIGEHGARLIQDGFSILTHCNTGALATGGIGTALGVIYVANEQGKKIKVFADETRPLLQGARLTIWELQQAGIDCVLLTDNMAGLLMKQGQVNAVIVGADRIARNGDTANKIGTYTVAVLAREHKIPFYVAAPASTFDKDTASGKEIEIENRSSDEVTNIGQNRIAPPDIKVFSPAFDITPNEYITGFITDEGIRPGGRKTE
jgi:methylthioribose-1-phosphate isomerase